MIRRSMAVILAMGLTACQVPSGVLGQAKSPGQPCPQAHAGADLTRVAVSACGFDIGPAIASLDCTQMVGMPKGFVAQRTPFDGDPVYATVHFSDAGCRLDGAGAGDELLIGAPISSTDVVEAVDFTPTGGPVEVYDLKLRCGEAGCVTFTIGGPGGGDDTWEQVDHLRPHSITMPRRSVALHTLVRGGQINRAIFAAHGRRITICLNGTCWSSEQSAVRVTVPGDAAFSIIGTDSRRPSSLQIARLLVFHAG